MDSNHLVKSLNFLCNLRGFNCKIYKNTHNEKFFSQVEVITSKRKHVWNFNTFTEESSIILVVHKVMDDLLNENFDKEIPPNPSPGYPESDGITYWAVEVDGPKIKTPDSPMVASVAEVDKPKRKTLDSPVFTSITNPFRNFKADVLYITVAPDYAECSYEDGLVHVLSPNLKLAYSRLEGNTKVLEYWGKRISSEFENVLVALYKEIRSYIQNHEITSVFTDLPDMTIDVLKEFGVFDGVTVHTKCSNIFGWK